MQPRPELYDRNPDRYSYDELLAHFERLLHKEVNKAKSIFKSRSIEVDDLLQEARIGLWRASQSWNVDRNPIFAQWARFIVKQQLQTYCEHQPKIEVPSNTEPVCPDPTSQVVDDLTWAQYRERLGSLRNIRNYYRYQRKLSRPAVLAILRKKLNLNDDELV